MASSDPVSTAGNGVYRPILRARRGELTALHHLDPTAAASVVPILEPGAPGAPHEVADLTRLIRDNTPRTARIAVDLSHLPDSADRLRSPALDLAEGLTGHGVVAVPVVRTFDSDRRLIEHGLAARMHGGHALLRVRPHADATNAAAATAACVRVWRGTGLDASQIDLVVDLADVVCGPRAERYEDRGRRILRWARSHPWHSITLAAGAMPQNLDDLPTDEAVPLARWDARFWSRVTESDIGYGDYGVTSPTRRYGVHHRQLPTLRYAADRTWWIYRWARRGGRSDDRCYELCRTLVDSAHWPSAGARFSWGDAEIASRARRAPGGGTSTSWIAWSTSHHLAQVLAELAARGRGSRPETMDRSDGIRTHEEG